MRLEAITRPTTDIKYLYTPLHANEQAKGVWIVYCTRNDQRTYVGAMGKSSHSLQLAVDDAERQLDEFIAKRDSIGYTQLPDVEIDLGDLLDF